MIGGIYSNQKCPLCGSNYKDDGKKGLICPNHKRQKADRFEVKIRGISRRFQNYDEAHRFLTGIRYKIDEGSFDKRDYQKENPLGFSNLIAKWLEYKKPYLVPKNYRNLVNYANKARSFFGDKNIKEIGYAELEDFIQAQSDISDKTKSNILSALHNFWVWLKKRRIVPLSQFPEFPNISYELGYRKVISTDLQGKILDEIYRISFHINPKIWLGVKWLSTYISIRPGELITLKEGDIYTSDGYIFFPHPKEKKHKLVPLIDEDIEILRSFPVGMPTLPFFRHIKGSGQMEGAPFGKHVFYNYWKRACKNLAIEGVDLYGGTKHSTARALRKHCTPEQIRRATMHSTNKAFERYFKVESDEVKEVYSTARSAKELRKYFGQSEKGKLLKYQDNNGRGGRI